MKIDFRFTYRRLKYFLIKIRYLFCNSIQLGNYVYIGKKTNLSNNIDIGDCSYIGQYSYIAPNVTVGNFALFSDNINIVGHDHKFEVSGSPTILSGIPDTVSTFIGDDVWLGHGVTIIRGVTIGNGSIVGANSVVTKDIPPYEIWAGVPAKKIRDRFTRSQVQTHEKFLNDYREGKILLTHDRKLSGDYF